MLIKLDRHTSYSSGEVIQSFDQYDIDDKKIMYKLFNGGVFGNSGVNFNSSLEAFKYSTRRGPVAIRTTKKAGGPCFYNLVGAEFLEKLEYLRSQGYTARDMQFSAMMPDKTHLVMQFYLMRDERYYTLHYSTQKGLSMRDAASQFQEATGLTAKYILQSKLDPTDYDDLMELFERFPNAVIEASVYSCKVGNMRRGMVVWEVRSNY